MNNHETPQLEVRQQVSHQEISRRAEELWRQSGSPQGRDDEIWLEAERQILGTGISLLSATQGSAGAGPSAAEIRPPVTSQGKGNARENELMEKKRPGVPKPSRGKSKLSER
jgi:Protein of unknown function (DUF2934)